MGNKDGQVKLPEGRIGVDMSDSAVRVFVFAKGKPCEADFSAVRESLPAAFASGADVRVCAPLRSVVTEFLTPPPMPRSRQEKILPSLLDVKLPFPADKARSVFSFTDDGHVVAETVRDSDMDEILEKCGELGMNPEAVVPPVSAFWEQAGREAPEWASAARRILCVAGEVSSLIIFGDSSGIRSCSVFGSSSGEAPRRARLSAGGGLDGAAVFLSGARSAEAERDFTASRTGAKVMCAASPEFFGARAAAYAACPGSNLRTGPYVHPVVVKRRCNAVLRASAALFMSGVLMTASGMAYMMKARSLRNESSSQLSLMLDTVAGYRVTSKGERALQDARSSFAERAELSVRNAAFSLVSSKFLPDCLDLCASHGIRLEHMDLSLDGLSVSGVAPDRESLEEFVSGVNASGMSAAISDEPAELPDGSVSFIIHRRK